MLEQLPDNLYSLLTGTVNAGSATTAILTTTGTTSTTTLLNTPSPQYLGMNQHGEISNLYESYESFKDMMEKYQASANPTTASEGLEKMISDMEGSDNELQQTAVKHMKYAKAYLDKMMLDAINERL